jgi:hypothetical protein
MGKQHRPDMTPQARVELARRLEIRRGEIEGAVLTRVYAVSDSSDLDPAYAEGLRAAVTAAIDYSLTAIVLGEERSPPPPPVLLTQARLAARAGVGLDTVLRRYCAGHVLLGDFLLEEVEGGKLSGSPALQGLLRTQAALFDRLLAAVSEEYGREEGNRLDTLEQRKAERVERLLAGELVDTKGLGYEFGGWHLGAIVLGTKAEEALRVLARKLDRMLLSIRHDEETVWAWLGGRRIDDNDLDRVFATAWPADLTLVLGEPGKGLGGWQLSHHQARAALSVAVRRNESLVRYSEVALLASMLQDELLATSLRQVYLEPLRGERDGGEEARKTLRAYFTAGRNVSSAAAALGVSRHTVANRLRSIEQRLGRPLGARDSCIEVALEIDELNQTLHRSHSRARSA